VCVRAYRRPCRSTSSRQAASSSAGWIWPEARLIVEYEGAHHFDELQIRQDDQRYRRLTAAGWRVIRLSSADLRDLAAVVARIASLLGYPLSAG
jgi:very-short-patch-repair endonuclease